MIKYSRYKDSKIELIGEIPDHWTLSKLTYLGEFYGGLSGKSGDDFNDEDSDLNKPFIPFTNIANNIYVSKDDFKKVKIVDSESQNKVFTSDILFMMSSENFEDLGKTSLLTENIDELYLNSFCKGFRITDKRIEPRFLNYLLLGNSHRQLISIEGNGFTRINLRSDRLKDTPVLVPPIEEQKLISRYLDKKNQQIDSLIDKTQKAVDCLEEQKKSLINQCVTKGLDRNVEMKGTNVEWMPEIPKHWKILAFKYAISVLTDFTANGSFKSLADNVEYLTEGYSRLVRLTDLRVDLQNEGIYVSKASHAYLKKSELFGGEILIANVGAYTGFCTKMLFNQGTCTLGPNMFLVKNNENTSDTDFLIYLLNSYSVQQQFGLLISSTAQPKINKDNLKSLIIVLPPKDEQIKIRNYLTDKINKINLSIAKYTKKIILLHEYKKSLMSYAVTGKVEITEDMV